MKSVMMTCVIALAVGLIPAAAASAQGFGTPKFKLTYKFGSSKKLYQVTGDCDWVAWDATTPPKTCIPTTSQTISRADVVGHDLGSNFEHNGKIIFLFGDTIGADSTYSPTWTTVSNPFKFHAGDTFADSYTLRAEDGLRLNYFLGNTPGVAATINPVYPPVATPSACAPGGIIATDADDTPSGGISINGQIYFTYSTGSDVSAQYAHLNDCSILVRFDEATQTFIAGRQLSQSYYPLPSSLHPPLTVPPQPGTPAGHFITNSMHILPPRFGLFGERAVPSPFGAAPWEPGVLIFGEGQHRGQTSGTSVYLSYIPAGDLWSGVDSRGNPATRYFAGLDKHNFPMWTTNEDDAVPAVYDNPNNVPVPQGPPRFADPGTVGEISVAYSQQLGLWLMTYDGGRQSGPNEQQTVGIYFSYAQFPWGPWTKPQLIFNRCRDGGLGNYMFYGFPANNFCPAVPNGSGPAGPTIGIQSKNDPKSTTGDPYAAEIIERFIEIDGDTLKLFYIMSTWNPYAVVMMESKFHISLNLPF
jgi:hypothetical protein